MNEKEKAIREELGIPPEANYVLIFSQSSHMDWDWKETFPILCSDGTSPYFDPNKWTSSGKPQKPAFEILKAAVEAIQTNKLYNDSKNRYYYSVAEIGFLQAFCEKYPDQLEKLLEVGDQLHIVGGGMTSPDGLLPHGEAFIRNFLLGKTWLKANNLPLFSNIWLPDNFGQGPQLPVMVEAMGLQAAGFARVPGADNHTPLDGKEKSIADQLLSYGVDFAWVASDESEILGHWMHANYYYQGDDIDQDNPNQKILGYINDNQNSSKTPYIFVPVGGDFQPPKQKLAQYADDWNSTDSKDVGYKATGVWVVAATFDHYIQLVDCYREQLKVWQPFNATPYWTGFYASRPALKTLHQAATRTLLGAEIFGIIADFGNGAPKNGSGSPLQTKLNRQQKAWWYLVPSTHHDYITGTAGTDFRDVYAQEQVPWLQQSLESGNGLIKQAIEEIAGSISIDLDQYDRKSQVPVAVFNQLGFEREGVVELPGGAVLGALSKIGESTDRDFVQPTPDGGLLFPAKVESLGYTTCYLSTKESSSGDTYLQVKSSDDGKSYVLENEYLQAVISEEANWGIEKLLDKKGTNPEHNLFNGTGSDFAFYHDTGDIYRYGNEKIDRDGVFMKPYDGVIFSTPIAPVIEEGPLRVTVTTQITVSVKDGPDSFSYSYIRTYSLSKGEPYLRLSVTGEAPDNTSIMVKFPFTNPVCTIVHGTPYHWDEGKMVLYWNPPVFYPTQNFLIPKTKDKQTLAAIYHGGIPSWGYDEEGALIGNVLRNTPGGKGMYGADAADRGTHTQHFALRAPSGLGGPETGQPLREALCFQTPLKACIVPEQLARKTRTRTGTRPGKYSLASVTINAGDTCPAVITSIKMAEDNPANLVVRLYQPTNNPLDVNVSLGLTQPAIVKAKKVTALEAELKVELKGEKDLELENGTMSVTTKRALTTLLIETNTGLPG